MSSGNKCTRSMTDLEAPYMTLRIHKSSCIMFKDAASCSTKLLKGKSRVFTFELREFLDLHRVMFGIVS